jgi:solute carrier family 25 protein 39/40
VWRGFGKALARHCESLAFRLVFVALIGNRTIAVPASTAYMLTYDHLNQSLPVIEAAPLLTPLTAGIASRSMVASLVSPLELVRTRLQSTPTYPGTPHTMQSVLDGIRSMVATDGARSLWRGLGPTLWRDVPFSGIYWAGYESGKRLLNRHGYTGVDAAFTSGAVSGMVSTHLFSVFSV